MNPDHEAWIKHKGRDIFSRLLRSSAYTHNRPTDMKRQIVMRVWEKDVPILIRDYDSAGVGCNGERSIGFGYLVEAFARKSVEVPQNTESAQHLAELLLGELSSGGVLTQLSRRMYNLDHLIITMRGRKAEISGYAEVKASTGAHLRHPEQIFLFEEGLRRVVKAIDDGKAAGTTHKFLAKRKIVISPKLRKLMIVPFGEGEAMAKVLPGDWETKEIEFSYKELIFLAQQIWPKSWPDYRFEPNFLGQFDEQFLTPLTDWYQSTLEPIFKDVSEFPARELLLFTASTKKLPLLPVDRAWVKEVITSEAVTAVWEDDKDGSIISDKEQREWEKRFIERFCYNGMELSKDFGRFFITKLRKQTAVLANILNKYPNKDRLQTLDDWNLLDL